MRKDLLQNKEWLYKKYITDKLSSVQIANTCECHSTTVINYLRKYNIKIRTISESNKGKQKFSNSQKIEMSKNAIGEETFKLLNNKKWLSKKYLDEKLTIEQIAKLCNCGSTTVWKFLNRHNIKTRNGPSALMANPDALNFLNNKDWMYKKYIEEKLSARKISKICGCSYSIVLKYLREYNIKIRDKSEQRRGENNPSWKGGVSFEPYCKKFNKIKREEIREKFERVCFLCGKNKEENFGRNLSVHHIDYNKMQGCKHSWHLISLCLSCHVKTNFNRHYWFNLLNNYWLLNSEINFIKFDIFVMEF